jgi:hypothetical protein
MHAEAKLKGNAWTILCVAVEGVILGLTACAPVQSPEGGVTTQSGITRPAWRTGDRWVYAWTVGSEKGAKTSEVVGLKEVGGVHYYVLRGEAGDWYYTLDLHWAAIIKDSRVAARVTPPQPWFNWPLDVGRRWEYQGVYEEKERKDRLRETYRVVGVEQVQVPAGTFRAYKLVGEIDSKIVDEYWYAPDVRWYVKWQGRRGENDFQEVLQEYVPGPRTTH